MHTKGPRTVGRPVPGRKFVNQIQINPKFNEVRSGLRPAIMPRNKHVKLIIFSEFKPRLFTLFVILDGPYGQ